MNSLTTTCGERQFDCRASMRRATLCQSVAALLCLGAMHPVYAESSFTRLLLAYTIDGKAWKTYGTNRSSGLTFSLGGERLRSTFYLTVFSYLPQ